MINPFQEIIKYDDVDAFEDYLNKINIIYIFKPIFDAYPDKDIAKGVIKFILLGYSIDSDMLHVGGRSWDRLSLAIYEKAGLPYDNEELRIEVTELKTEVLLKVVDSWLRYQDNENWRQYITYRDLRDQMLKSSLSDIRTASGEINYEQKMKNAVHSQVLLKMMNEARETFI